MVSYGCVDIAKKKENPGRRSKPSLFTLGATLRFALRAKPRAYDIDGSALRAPSDRLARTHDPLHRLDGTKGERPWMKQNG